MNANFDKKIRELSRPSLFLWSYRILLDWALVAVLLFQARYFNNVLSYSIAIVLLGSLQQAIGIMGHEGAHRRISRNKKFNDFLANLFCFAPLMMPLNFYRDFHFSHHRHVGTEKDGEMLYKKDFSPLWDLPLKKNQIARNLLRDYLGFGLPIIIRMGMGTGKAPLHDRLPIYFFWSFIIATLVLTHTTWILPLWFGASMSSFWAAFRFRLWAEHMGTSGTYRYQSTFIQRLLWLPHNIDIHWEHHKYPSIPLWNLKKVRALLRAERPIIPLKEVLKSLESSPVILSGTILIAEEDEPIILDEST